MGNSQWEREWNGLHNWESRAHRLHEVIGTQHCKSTEDATLLYNNLVVEHLENNNAYVRSVFIDFSSAFNTLKPDIVINKLRTLNVSPILCKFILDFLTNREQRVRINDILSSVLSISTGAPQGCVLSAILFIIHKWSTITFQKLSSDQICWWYSYCRFDF